MATADEFSGGDRHLRRDLQACGVGYVLAAAKSHRVTARRVDAADNGQVGRQKIFEGILNRLDTEAS